MDLQAQFHDVRPPSVPKDATKHVEVALHRMAAVMSQLCNDTMLGYLWKWLPESRGLTGPDLINYVKEKDAAFSVVDSKNDPVTHMTSITYAYARKLPGKPFIEFACRLDFKVVKPKNVKGDNIILEFGHEEIPFPKDIKTIKT